MKVSVVMATYNGLKYLPIQIDTVVGQLQLGDELVVVDDASSDGTVDYIRSLQSRFIRLIENPANQGVFASFETGLLAATGDVIFLCDQDDVWLPGKRDTMTACFDADASVQVVISDAQLVDGQGHVFAPSFMATRGGFHGSIWSTLVRNRYLGCAMAIRRDLLRVALPIPKRVPMHDMWVGALGALLGRVDYVDRPLIQYRRHGGNVSPSTPQGILQMVRWRLTLAWLLATRMVRVGMGSRLAVRPEQ
jgi:glycosyltransferase involved in cell wall biosynthesis